MTWFGVANSGEILFSSPGDGGLFGFAELAGDVSGVLQNTTVKGIAGFPVPLTTPASGQIIKFDGTQWQYAPDLSGAASVAHNLLSPTHSDTVTSAPVQGGIIRANSTPAWEQLALGTAEFVVYSDGTDVLYTRLGQNTPFEDGTLPAPSVTFDSDRGAGLYLQESGIFGLVAEGVELIEVNGLSGVLDFNAGQVVKTRAGATTTILPDDYVYLVTSGGADITLPANPIPEQVYIIKDRDGNAAPTAIDRIAILGNGNSIDGNVNIRITQRYGAFTLLFNGTEWNII